MHTADIDVIKDIPGYKVILKAVLRSQIQQLVEQLAAHTDEESVILTANMSDGTLGHLGSETGKHFLDGHDDMKSQFLGFCLERWNAAKQSAKPSAEAPTSLSRAPYLSCRHEPYARDRPAENPTPALNTSSEPPSFSLSDTLKMTNKMVKPETEEASESDSGAYGDVDAMQSQRSSSAHSPWLVTDADDSSEDIRKDYGDENKLFQSSEGHEASNSKEYDASGVSIKAEDRSEFGMDISGGGTSMPGSADSQDTLGGPEDMKSFDTSGATGNQPDMPVEAGDFNRPGTPMGPLEAKDIKGETLTLNWNPPKDNDGERIGNYIVEKNPKGSDKWIKNGSPESEEPARVAFNSDLNTVQLACKAAERTDTGRYTVNIKNDIGSDSATLNVIVVAEGDEPVPSPAEASPAPPIPATPLVSPPSEDPESPMVGDDRTSTQTPPLGQPQTHTETSLSGKTERDKLKEQFAPVEPVTVPVPIQTSSTLKVPKSSEASPSQQMKVPQSSKESPSLQMKVPQSSEESPSLQMKVPQSSEESPSLQMKVPKSSEESPSLQMKVPQSSEESPSLQMKVPQSSEESPSLQMKVHQSSQESPSLQMSTASSSMFTKASLLAGSRNDTPVNNVKTLTNSVSIASSFSSESTVNITNSLQPETTALVKSSLDILGGELILDKSDLIAKPTGSAAPGPVAGPVAGSVDTSVPWIVTVSMHWNNFPAIMINNQPFVRLVDIHKQILPAKDTDILQTLCQLTGIPVENCSEMQRYFLVQYGRAFNSKSTLIVSKDNANELIGYYVDPQPKTARMDDHKSITDHHREQLRRIALSPARRAAIRARRVTGRNEEDEPRAIRDEMEPMGADGTLHSVVEAVRPVGSLATTVPTVTAATDPSLGQKRATRQKEINFLKMLRGNSSSQAVDDDDPGHYNTKITKTASPALPLYRSRLVSSESRDSLDSPLSSHHTPGGARHTPHNRATFGSLVHVDTPDNTDRKSGNIAFSKFDNNLYLKEAIPGFKKVIVEQINERDLKIPTCLQEEMLEKESKTREIVTHTDFDVAEPETSEEKLNDETEESIDKSAPVTNGIIPFVTGTGLSIANNLESTTSISISDSVEVTAPLASPAVRSERSLSQENLELDTIKINSPSPMPSPVVTDGPLRITKPREREQIHSVEAPLLTLHRDSSTINVSRSRTQLGELFIDKYVTKTSPCIQCYTCRRMMSVDSFRCHLHDIVTGGLLAIDMPRMMDTTDTNMSDRDRNVWEAFQRKKELFDNNQQPSPDIQEGIYGLDSDSNHSLPETVTFGKSSNGPRVITTPVSPVQRDNKVQLPSRRASLPVASEALDRVRSSGRKRKKKRLYPFEEYTFAKFPRLHGVDNSKDGALDNQN